MAYGEIIFWSLVFFLLGIGLGGSSWSGGVVVVVACVLSFVLYMWKSLPVRWLIFFIIVAFAGAFYFHLYSIAAVNSTNLPEGKITLQAAVIELPRSYDNLTVISMKALPPWDGEFDLLVNAPINLQYGEVVEVAGSFKETIWPETPTMNGRDVKRVGHLQSLGLRGELINIRERLIESIYRILPSDRAAFIAGITVGARGGMSSELREAMRASGTTHLVVLSGYNILIVVLIARRLLEKVIGRRARFYIISIALFLFLMLVAIEPSITRAGIMGWLVLLGEYWGRLIHFGYLILLTGAVMLLFDPSLLISSIGFQLSFLSLIGIAYVAPTLKGYLEKYLQQKASTPLVEALYETAAAQFMVWPLLSFYFGSVSLTSLLANMLILPIMPFMMALGVAVSFIATLNIQLGLILGIVLRPFVEYILAVIHLFSWLTLPLPNLNQPVMLLVVYGLLAIWLAPKIVKNSR